MTTINCPNCQSEMSQLFGADHAGCANCGHVQRDAFRPATNPIHLDTQTGTLQFVNVAQAKTAAYRRGLTGPCIRDLATNTAHVCDPDTGLWSEVAIN